MISKMLWQIMCFGQNVGTQQPNKQFIHKNPCRSRELNLGPLAPQSGCVITAPPSQHREAIVVKLFNCKM